ncbi:MAG: hypothetical protein LUQ22_06525 [Methanotrichaceae archaeon]|nr:hypothetical protein [Methanotrichaceae archaeon]
MTKRSVDKREKGIKSAGQPKNAETQVDPGEQSTKDSVRKNGIRNNSDV